MPEEPAELPDEPPEETVAMISTDTAALARRFQVAIGNPESAISYCYCSIFDECCLADSSQDLQNPEPREACPDFGDAAFQN